MLQGRNSACDNAAAGKRNGMVIFEQPPNVCWEDIVQSNTLVVLYKLMAVRNSLPETGMQDSMQLLGIP